jgi:hypothetical protein
MPGRTEHRGRKKKEAGKKRQVKKKRKGKNIQSTGFSAGQGYRLSHRPKLLVSRSAIIIEGELPLDVEAELFDRLPVSEIQHLLKNHRPHHGVKLIGRSAVHGIIMFFKQMHGQYGEDLIPKQFGPGAVQQASAFRPQMSEAVEHVDGFVVFDVKHTFSIQLLKMMEKYTINAESLQ